jgi:peptidoglycan/xylan/chitin deacetylase (PgdA/CDA1 family)
MQLPAHDRYGYLPLPARRDYSWPQQARLAVCFCNNIEVFAFGAGLGSDSAVIGAPQSQRNYAWRDYGNRVGMWYLFDLFDELNVPAAHNVNSTVFEHCPAIAERIRARGDEVVGHGRTNSERQGVLWEADEARLIAECTDVLTRAVGRAPEGWMGPWLSQSAVTLDLLKEAGYRYVMDWPLDDQPVWMRTRAGPILSVPYPIEVNDSPALVYRQHSGREFADMMVDQFDELLEQSRKWPLVFSVSLHPFIVGQPFRLRPLRQAMRHILQQRDALWVTTPGEVARYCATLPQGVVPGS